MEFDAYKKLKVETRPMEPDADVKHLAMLAAIAPYAKAKVQKNVTTVDIKYAYRNTKLLLILCPEWAPMFPPFNLARLSAVAKGAGYESTCIDLNIKAYNQAKIWLETKKIDFNPWDGTRDWKWQDPTEYYKYIHPHLVSILTECINKIVENPPDVIGFTMYYTNAEPVKYMVRELRKVLPNIKILVGGPNIRPCAEPHHWSGEDDNIFDYVINGEGELLLLEILTEIENGINHASVQKLAQPEEQRLNLNDLPRPDYTTFDFNEYEFPNGINSEISRGCTAKCTFCEETHFWKYRQRMATDVLNEIETLYYEKGTDIVWFIDSLVNGNLNELRAFCKGIIAKGMKIHWTGYARCDGRMDLAFYQDLADSGCHMLNYGIESGSQAVLDSIDKGVTIAEMEENFENGEKTGIGAFTNWIVGFPTETYQNFSDSMTFLWRNRNKNIINIAAGFGFGLAQDSIVGQNPDKFNLSPHKYAGGWITKDYKLSKFHVTVRMKIFAIFLQHLKSKNHINVPHRPNLPQHHYKIVFDDPLCQQEIEYENFDYNIIFPDISNFADSLVNEIFTLFRILWRTRGGFTAEIKFDQELDLLEFGERNAGPYWANHKFSIDKEGNWNADFKYWFKQPTANPNVTDPLAAKIPFFAQDYSRQTSNAAIRARKLAKPQWGEGGRNHDEFMELIMDEKYLNRTIDFSFNHSWQGAGTWKNPELYTVAVPNTHTTSMKNYNPINFDNKTVGESIITFDNKTVGESIIKWVPHL